MSRLVLIDDDDLVRESVSKLLEIRGHQVTCFESAEALLETAGYRDADCLVVDFRLPVMNGCELLYTLRAMSVDTPALLLSGNVGLIWEAMPDGIPGVHTLEKPCPSQDLYTAVEKCLAQAE